MRGGHRDAMQMGHALPFSINGVTHPRQYKWPQWVSIASAATFKHTAHVASSHLSMNKSMSKNRSRRAGAGGGADSSEGAVPVPVPVPAAADGVDDVDDDGGVGGEDDGEDVATAAVAAVTTDEDDAAAGEEDDAAAERQDPDSLGLPVFNAMTRVALLVKVLISLLATN